MVHVRAADKRRPVLLLTRDDVIEALNEIIVAPATRTILGISSEILLAADDGFPVTCALNFDHVSLTQRSRLDPVLATLPEQQLDVIAGPVCAQVGARVPRWLRATCLPRSCACRRTSVLVLRWN